MNAESILEKRELNWFDENAEMENETSFISWPQAILAMNEFLKESLSELYELTRHGDEDHQKWLKDKFDSYIELPNPERSVATDV